MDMSDLSRPATGCWEAADAIVQCLGFNGEGGDVCCFVTNTRCFKSDGNCVLFYCKLRSKVAKTELLIFVEVGQTVAKKFSVTHHCS